MPSSDFVSVSGLAAATVLAASGVWAAYARHRAGCLEDSSDGVDAPGVDLARREPVEFCARPAKIVTSQRLARLGITNKSTSWSRFGKEPSTARDQRPVAPSGAQELPASRAPRTKHVPAAGVAVQPSDLLGRDGSSSSSSSSSAAAAAATAASASQPSVASGNSDVTMSNLTAEELAELGDGVVLVTPHTPAAIAEALGRQTILSAAKRQVYEDEALGLWTKFYARNEDKFYKDRHYIREVWAKYLIDPPGRTVMLEVGCGTGATIFPLLRRNPRLMAYACDFAETAVELVRTNQEFIPLHAAGRAEAFQADITLAEQLPGPLVAPGSVDVVTVIFVLGAIPPQKMPAAVANIARCLRSGGHVLLRDYGRHDQAQIRFASRLDDNLYVRTYDGTLAFYFEVDELKALFDEAGFDAVDVNYVTRNIVNRKKGIAMRRKWVHGVFRKR